VIDDVLGLVVLAIISGVIQAAALGETLEPSGIVVIVAKALVFLVAAIVLGSYLSPRVFRHALALRAKGIVLALSLGFCFGLAWLAGVAGLAPIVGAFAASLVLEERRGEVGLIFAGIGASLVLGGHAVVSPDTYAAAVFMVFVTTMATPPLLLWSLRRDATQQKPA